MHRNEWVENADRWVAGFLEMFEEGFHKMVRFLSLLNGFLFDLQLYAASWFMEDLSHCFYQGTVIRDRIQEGIRKQQLKRLLYDENDNEELYGDNFENESYDEDEN